MGGEGFGYGGWGLSKGGVWAVGGANAQDPQGWKRPRGLWGVGLRLKKQKGPRHAPHPLSQRAGDLTWELSRLPGLGGWGECPPLVSCSSGLGGSLLPASTDLPGLRGADPIWPPLLLPPQSPYVLLVHFGVPPFSLGVRVPYQQPAGALVVGRR